MHVLNYFKKSFLFGERLHLKCKNSQLIADIISYIDEHIYDEISVKDITSSFFISRSYLYKLFLQEIGLSIHQFIIKKKLFLARQELLDNTSITDISTKYSFGNYSSFYRNFLLEFGQSPQSFKKQNT